MRAAARVYASAREGVEAELVYVPVRPGRELQPYQPPHRQGERGDRMTMDRALVGTSRFISRVLRHAPESVGLRLDAAGWVEVDELLSAARRAGVALDRPTLERVVAENDKKRFALSADGRRIRASQGHSVRVELGLEPVEPPEVLYHGTADRSLDSIRRDGLRPGRRTHVHLSADEETAAAVGRRHGRPVVLRVAAGRLHRAGHPFHRSDNGVWLTPSVPPDALTLPPGPGD